MQLRCIFSIFKICSWSAATNFDIELSPFKFFSVHFSHCRFCFLFDIITHKSICSNNPISQISLITRRVTTPLLTLSSQLR